MSALSKHAAENVTPLHSARVAALFREHNRALIAYLQCRLDSAADAQELAQEAYERVLTLDSPERIDSLRAYLYRIAANLTVDRLRMRKVREALPEEATEADWHRVPVPERHATTNEEFGALRVALRELPAKSAQAFILHVIEGRGFDAIARSMKLSERMVRYHVTRALAHCRARVAQGEN